MKFILLLLGALATCCTPVSGQDSLAATIKKNEATVKGRIISDSSKAGIENITVSLPSSGILTISDSLGYFVLEGVHFGRNVLRISQESGITDTLSIYVNRSDFDLGAIPVKIVVLPPDTTWQQVPVMAYDENMLMDQESPVFLPSLLSSYEDPFLSVVASHLLPLNFRFRGYAGNSLEVYMNGILLNNSKDGNFATLLLGGLNEVQGDKSLSYGLQADDTYFGGLNGSTTMEIHASEQQQKTLITYGNSNRSYKNRVALVYHSGLMDNGWALSVAASKRWANEGYVPGTSLQSYAYYLGLSKRVGRKGFLHFNTFAAPSVTGGTTAVTQEAIDLTGTEYYNPGWGYQNGKKRNARQQDFFQPLFLLQYEYRPDRVTMLSLAAAFKTGYHAASSLDWYNAPDPRPDYYQNMPSYWIEHNQPDPAMAAQYTQQWLNDETTGQINWPALYDRNRANMENINGHYGMRSRYVLGADRKDTRNYSFALNIKREAGAHFSIRAGAGFSMEWTEHYRKLLDLLGGDFYVNLNQFAENTFPGHASFNQVDLIQPDKIVSVGDRYGYNYGSLFKKGMTWIQGAYSLCGMHIFLAGRMAMDEFNRTGFYKNGLFPEDSYGASKMLTSYTYQIKGGGSYSLNKWHSLYIRAAAITTPPLFEHTFISPSTRNTLIANPVSEKVVAIEGGYILQSPLISGRMTFFATDIKDAVSIRRFYYEDYTSFVNYVMQGINIRHTGLELALSATISPSLHINLAASGMQVFYTSRPEVSIYRDNDTARAIGKATVYSEGYYTGSGPQTVAVLGFNYRSLQRWFAGIHFNYLDRNYVEMNPTRLTAEAVALLAPQSEQWQAIRKQERLPAVFTVDISGGKTFRLYKKCKKFSRKTACTINGGMSNILDNKRPVSASQQLRFDYIDKNPDQFPAKYRYGTGIAYFVTLKLTF